MTLAGTVKAMVEAGCTPDQIAIVVAAHKTEAKKKKALKREKNAARMRRYRAAVALRNAHERARAVCNAHPPEQKEPFPPTPPLLEKLNSPLSVTDVTIVDEAVDVNEISSLAEGRKRNVTLFQTVVGMWNETAAGYHLVAVRDITTTRQAAILARSEDFLKTYDFPDAIDGWRKLMGLVRGSPFLRGELNGFRCDFDFVTRASSFTKIMEGKYEARQAAKRR